MTPPLLQNQRRYVVYFDCPETGITKTYAVWAVTAAVATARTTLYIKDERHHKSDEAYYLLPRIDRSGKADYEII